MAIFLKIVLAAAAVCFAAAVVGTLVSLRHVIR